MSAPSSPLRTHCKPAILFLTVAAAAAVFFGTPAIARAEKSWDPEKTWVFVIGVLEWQDPSLAPFPKKKRRDLQLVNFFRDAGVPPEQIVYLQDSNATLKNIEAQLAEFLPKADAGDLLVTYYCGHGYPASDDPSKILMANYDASDDVEGWPFTDLVSAIEGKFGGEMALLLADCCHAGGAVTAVKAAKRRVNYAILGSAAANIESTGNWTFTEAVLEAFRGSPAVDLDEDGEVTLREAQQFAQAEMRFAENQESSWLIGGDGMEDYVLAEARERDDPRIGAHAEVEAEGKTWKARVTAVEGDEVQVFYYGWEQSDSEWVGEDRIHWAEESDD